MKILKLNYCYNLFPYLEHNKNIEILFNTKNTIYDAIINVLKK
jgi:hypothetical protein